MFKRMDYSKLDNDIRSQKELILQRDWDVLIILDACRYDALESVTEEEVEPARVPSKYSTPGYLKEIWDREGWKDVTYVSGTPYTKGIEHIDLRIENFSLDERVKKHVKGFEHSSLSDGVVHPKILNRLALQHDPPMVVHYMQPHDPYIGKISFNFPQEHEILPDKEDSRYIGPIPRAIESGHLSPEIVREAYYENVKLVVEYAKRLSCKFKNPVITADHGEALGEDNNWDHGGSHPVSMIVGWWER